VKKHKLYTSDSYSGDETKQNLVTVLIFKICVQQQNILRTPCSWKLYDCLWRFKKKRERERLSFSG